MNTWTTKFKMTQETKCFISKHTKDCVNLRKHAKSNKADFVH